jgi:2'-5' RNA ligase
VANGTDVQRLFLGVDLDAGTRAIIASHLATHVGDDLPGRAVPPPNWHLTLRFLGSARPDQADRVLHDLSGHALPAAFRIRFDRLGAFPRAGRATVLWLGIDKGEDEITAVAAACEEAARSAGFDAEDRPFHPHLTVSRIRPPVDASRLIEATPALQATLDVSDVTLFESHLGRGPARYDVVERIAL